MAVELRRIRVFVSSPADVPLERAAVGKVVADINTVISAFAPESGAIVEAVLWETHAWPALGRVQQVITEQIGPYDIFIGVMWKRFGTPTGVAESGTEEEFRLAYDSWSREKRPKVLFYFCQAPYPPMRSVSEAEQLMRVVAFREELSKQGLVWDYPDHTSFGDTVRSHLIREISQMIRPAAAPSVRADQLLRLSGDFDVNPARVQVRELAKNYQGIRDSMPPGDERTGKMELIATQMRELASVAYPLLRELMESAAPGERLAAVSILKVIAHPDHLHWLAERLHQEQPFVAYHAAVALITAVRVLGHQYLGRLRVEIEYALKAPNITGTDRELVLQNALRELAVLRAE